MKIKSVSGFTLFVKNLSKSARFYESLGFATRKRETSHVTVYSNWFWIDLIAAAQESRPGYKKAAALRGTASAPLVYLSVDDVDGFHKALVSRGLKPASEPHDWPSGNREFVIRDPDGYNLVIFKKN